MSTPTDDARTRQALTDAVRQLDAALLGLHERLGITAPQPQPRRSKSFTGQLKSPTAPQRKPAIKRAASGPFSAEIRQRAARNAPTSPMPARVKVAQTAPASASDMLKLSRQDSAQ
ncbi:MAG TPA: hypothetical protein V6D47_15540 [Oscillatoriaceae cyanobacterium]